jgi:hypothetical protein
MRVAGLAPVPEAANAGIIESSNGKANVVPTPRKNVRRGIAFLKIIMTVVPSSSEMERS